MAYYFNVEKFIIKRYKEVKLQLQNVKKKKKKKEKERKKKITKLWRIPKESKISARRKEV
jgi:hypothetical protein